MARRRDPLVYGARCHQAVIENPFYRAIVERRGTGDFGGLREVTFDRIEDSKIRLTATLECIE